MKAQLTFLSESEVQEIHEATLTVLEKTGVKVHSEAVLAHLGKAGAKVEGDRVRFPKEMMKEAIAQINREVFFAAREERYDFRIPTGGRTFNSTSGYSPFIYDEPFGKRRNTTAQDLATIAKLCSAIDEVDFFWPIAMPTEETAPEMEEISAFNTAIRHIGKHVECSCASPGAAQWQIRIAEAIAGGSDALRKRPLFSAVASPTTPLAFEKCTVEALPLLARAGIPVTPMNVPLAGTTAPATFAGTLVITNAEQLATLAILKAYNEEAPMVYAADTGSANLKTGDVAYSNPDYDLFSIACGDLAKFYRIPACVAHGSSEKRDFDRLSGFMYNVMRIAFSQITATDTSVWMGSLDDSLSTSLWDIVLDAEALRYAKIFCKELAVNRDSLALDVIDEVGPRGEFISHQHTFDHFRKEINNLDPLDSPLLQSGENYLAFAQEKARTLLANAEDKPLDDAMLAELNQYMTAARKEFDRK